MCLSFGLDKVHSLLLLLLLLLPAVDLFLDPVICTFVLGKPCPVAQQIFDALLKDGSVEVDFASNTGRWVRVLVEIVHWDGTTLMVTVKRNYEDRDKHMFHVVLHRFQPLGRMTNTVLL